MVSNLSVLNLTQAALFQSFGSRVYGCLKRLLFNLHTYQYLQVTVKRLAALSAKPITKCLYI